MANQTCTVVTSDKGGGGKSLVTLVWTEGLISITKESGELLEEHEIAQIVDWDPQKTLTFAAKFTGRYTPVEPEEATARYVTHDTAPYKDASRSGLLKLADVILIPTLVGYSDLLGIKSTIDQICELGVHEKATIVFNKVRKPYNKSYYAIKELFMKNYPHIKIAKTELSELKAFQEALVKPLDGLAKQQVRSLINEVIFSK